MKQKEFIKIIKKLREKHKFILGDYIFFVQDNKYYIYNSYKQTIENDYTYNENGVLEMAHDYRFVIKRYENKPLTGREKITFQGRFPDSKKKEFRNDKPNK